MKVDALFQQSHVLPSIPKVVQELIQSFSDENINLSKVGDKIAMDQVITAKVLRLANSARYGLPRKVTNVSDAVVLLGFNALRTLVLASGVTGAFPKTGGLDKKHFWGDTFAVAAIAKAIAKQIKRPVNAETAFTCGLLHNIGELFMHVVIPEEMTKMAGALEMGKDRRLTEQNMLGFDYTIVGTKLAALWHFPDDIQRAIAEQWDPLAVEDVSVLACILRLATLIRDHVHADADSTLELPADVVEYLEFDVAAFMEKEADIREQASAFDALID